LTVRSSLTSPTPIREAVSAWRLRDLAAAPNPTLVLRPASSPAPNPVEKLWRYHRDRHLSHRLLRNVAAAVDACCAAWNRLVAAPGRLPVSARRDVGIVLSD
jgi:hypothetical protein